MRYTRKKAVVAGLLANNARMMAPIVLATIAMAAPAAAHAASPTYKVGDVIYNPALQAYDAITAVVNSFTVQTANGYYITTAQSPGDQFVYNGITYTVVGYQAVKDKNGIDGVTTLYLDNSLTGQQEQLSVAVPIPTNPTTGPDTVISYVPASGDQNAFVSIQKGGNGKNGHDGAIIVPAAAGAPGKNGPTNTVNVTIPTVTKVADGNSVSAGIYVASIGGNGGNGGNSYLNISGGGKPGGKAGAGGVVNLTVGAPTSITTSGDGVYGIIAQSAGGQGGKGGSGGTGGQGGKGGKGYIRVQANKAFLNGSYTGKLTQGGL